MTLRVTLDENGATVLKHVFRPATPFNGLFSEQARRFRSHPDRNAVV
jgi:hypothetical protein